MVKQTGTGRALPMPVGFAWGTATSLSAVILGTAITAKLIDSEVITWDSTGYMILTILILSSWIGGLTSYQKIKRQKVTVCLVNGILLFLSLFIITALFFGGQYSGVGETALLIACGSILAVFTENREKRKNIRKMRLHNR